MGAQDRVVAALNPLDRGGVGRAWYFLRMWLVCIAVAVLLLTWLAGEIPPLAAVTRGMAVSAILAAVSWGGTGLIERAGRREEL